MQLDAEEDVHAHYGIDVEDLAKIWLMRGLKESQGGPSRPRVICPNLRWADCADRPTVGTTGQRERNSWLPQQARLKLPSD